MIVEPAPVVYGAPTAAVASYARPPGAYGAARIPGRISSAAMLILADDSGYSPTEVFTANQAKIRSAACKSRRFNPQLAMVLLGVNDFS